MQYTQSDLNVGTKLRCTNDKDFSHWTTGKVYTVQYGTMNNYVECDDGTEISLNAMLSRLNKENRCDAEFEIIKEEEQMTYTEKDIREGTKLICTKANISWWTTAKVYEVSMGKEDGNLFIKDNQGHDAYVDYMLDCLNGNHVVEFEIIKEEKEMQYTENDIKEGTELRCTDDGEFDWWTNGRIYTVVNGCISDNDGDTYDLEYILEGVNGDCKHAKFEIVEYPTATITVDVEQRLNDRIELLHKERMNIIDKIERMEGQRCKLRDKIQKLTEAKEALKVLKEFK